MMSVRLFCPYCAKEATEKKENSIASTLMPISQINDSGTYKVVCSRKHESVVVLKNIKFELLFELGLNALVDGYYREAVSSCTSSLERFYEFYWRVVMHKHSIPANEIALGWNQMSKQSERQLGGYISAGLLLTGKIPKLLNPNKDVAFRNQVIHNGYVPELNESKDYCNNIMNIINEGLAFLRIFALRSLEEVYDSLTPTLDENIKNSKNEIGGSVNILNAVDVLNPPDPKKGDVRQTDISGHIDRVVRERQPHRQLFFYSEEDMNEYLKNTTDQE